MKNNRGRSKKKDRHPSIRKGTSKGTRRKNTRLNNYSKRKNLKKSTTKKRQKYSKMKGGGDLPEEANIPLEKKINFTEYELSTTDKSPYNAFEDMEIQGATRLLLGVGSGGDVLEFTMKRKEEDTPVAVAVKIIRLTPGITEKKAKVEYYYQRKLSNEKNKYSRYFAKVYNFFSVNDENCGIVMELLEPRFQEGLDLSKLIKANQLEHKVHYCLELARAISATHKMGIVHGDLKPENVAIANDGDGSQMGQLKLVDFGLSFRAGDKGGKDKIDCCRKGYGGTSAYFSYETLEIFLSETARRQAQASEVDWRPAAETPKHYGAASDWWSYGVMVFEITMGMGILEGPHHPCLFGSEEWGDSTEVISNESNLKEYWSEYLKVWGGMKATPAQGKKALEMTPEKINQYWNHYKRLVNNPKIEKLEEDITSRGQEIEGLRKELALLKEKYKDLQTESGTSKDEGGDENEPFADALSPAPKEKIEEKIEEKIGDIRNAERREKEVGIKNERQIGIYRDELKTEPTEKETLLLQLAFQFFVLDPKKRPFLCLDKEQMEDYDGTTDGVRAEALGKIVADLKRIEALG